MNVLVIAPHPDDEAIGCGGSIRLHADRGDRVTCAFLTSGELGIRGLPPADVWRVREAEAGRAAAVLGLADVALLRCPDGGLRDGVEAAADRLRDVLRRHDPQLVYLPHPHEWHPDHAAVPHIVRAALGGTGLRPRLLGYEVWSPMPAHDHVQDVTASMARKLAAIRCYPSQLAAFDYARAVRGLNRFRGVMAARTRFAEVFSSVEADARCGGPAG